MANSVSAGNIGISEEGTRNIHRALCQEGFELYLGAQTFLSPKQRYVMVAYQDDLREELRFAKGETGLATTLTLLGVVEPKAVLQCYPAAEEGKWYVYLLDISRRDIIGFAKPLDYREILEYKKAGRRHEYFGGFIKDALTYRKPSSRYMEQRPWITTEWLGLDLRARRLPVGAPIINWREFIQESQLGTKQWPAPEPAKPVNTLFDPWEDQYQYKWQIARARQEAQALEREAAQKQQ